MAWKRNKFQVSFDIPFMNLYVIIYMQFIVHITQLTLFGFFSLCVETVSTVDLIYQEK